MMMPSTTMATAATTTTLPSTVRALVLSTTLWLGLIVGLLSCSTVHSYVVPYSALPSTRTTRLSLIAAAAYDDIDHNKNVLPPKRQQAQAPYQQQDRPPNGKRGRPMNSTNPTKNKNNYNTKNGDQRTKVKGGVIRYNNNNNKFPQFNSEIVNQETALDVLSLLASKKGALSIRAGGGAVSLVNLCTSLHRIAKHVNNYMARDHPGNNRGRILSDPRFAMLACGLTERLLDAIDEKKPPGPRELSNIAWAIAKLNIAPPNSAMAVNTDEAEVLLRAKAEQLRSTIMDIAKQRAVALPGGRSPQSSSSSWIPLLSELFGNLMDTISAMTTSFEYKDFKQQEFSNLIWAQTVAKRETEPVFSFVLNGMISSVNNPRKTDGMIMPQEWSIPLWCLAKTGLASCHVEQILPFVNNLLDNEPGLLERFNPQELSNSVYAAAKILSQQSEEPQGLASAAALGICRHAARELIRRGGGPYKSQELTNTAWAMATLGFGIKNDESSGTFHSRRKYIFLPSDDPEGDRVLMEQTLSIVLHEMKENLRKFSLQELNNMCWSKARLNQRDDELLDMIGAQLANPHRSGVTPQDLSTSLWAMATMGYANKAVYRAVVARITEAGVDRFKPQEFSNTLWALATADVVPEYLHVFDDKLLPDNLRPSMDEAMTDPVTACFALGASELIRRPFEFKPQEIKDVIWSFAKVGMRHPVLFQTIAEHLVGKGDDPNLGGRGGLSLFSSQGVSNLAYAYAKHSQIGSEVLEQYGKQCRLPHAGGRLGCYTVSFLDVGEGLLQKLFSEVVRVDLETHDKLRKVSPQDVSNTVWSFHILGLRHSEFLETVNSNLLFRMESYLGGNKSPMNVMKGFELSSALLSLASLNYTPPKLLQTVEAYLMELMDYEGKWTVPMVARIFSRQEVANLAWAVAVFGVYPKHLIEMIYVGLTGIGDWPDPSYLQESFGDDGINRLHVVSLLYLQTMMDLDAGPGKTCPFQPPDDFPGAWMTSPASSNWRAGDENSGGTRGSNMMGEDFLKLNTSKTQNDVSKAFSRIGFTNVEEFVHTMENLAVEYGIQMSPNPMELLSIDIANVEMKIAVEVDGPTHFLTRIDGVGTDSGGSTTVGNFETSGTKLQYNFNWGKHSQEITGSTALKQRILKQLGWRIINIPFWDWQAVAGDADAEDKFCQDLLNNVEEEQ